MQATIIFTTHKNKNPYDRINKTSHSIRPTVILLYKKKKERIKAHLCSFYA